MKNLVWSTFSLKDYIFFIFFFFLFTCQPQEVTLVRQYWVIGHSLRTCFCFEKCKTWAVEWGGNLKSQDMFLKSWPSFKLSTSFKKNQFCGQDAVKDARHQPNCQICPSSACLHASTEESKKVFVLNLPPDVDIYGFNAKTMVVKMAKLMHWLENTTHTMIHLTFRCCQVPYFSYKKKTFIFKEFQTLYFFRPSSWNVAIAYLNEYTKSVLDQLARAYQNMSVKK